MEGQCDHYTGKEESVVSHHLDGGEYPIGPEAKNGECGDNGCRRCTANHPFLGVTPCEVGAEYLELV